MKRYSRMAAVMVTGLVLASGARADYFFKRKLPIPPSPATQPQSDYVSQTTPPPLSSAAPVQEGAPTQAARTVVAGGSQDAVPPSAAPKNLPTSVAPGSQAGVTPTRIPEMGAQQVMRINYKTLQLSYEIKDLGPSGTAGVEIWCTRDGQTWRKFDGIQRENPCWVQLDEGLIGITLIARTGYGGGKAAPVAGDQPQLWVDVDLTKPVLFLNGVTQADGTRTLNISWTAEDEKFGSAPISLYYAEQKTGPWVPFAVGLKNTGNYTWHIPPGAPNSFTVRIAAADMAGNVTTADTPSPVQIDLARPEVTNIRASAPTAK